MRDGLGGGPDECLVVKGEEMFLRLRSRAGVPLTFADCFLDELGKRKTDFQDECEGDKGDGGVCMVNLNGRQLRLRGRSGILDRLAGQHEHSREERRESGQGETGKKKMFAGKVSEGASSTRLSQTGNATSFNTSTNSTVLLLHSSA